METISRILTWIMALAIGAVFGTAGTISYASMPWGLPFGIIVSLLGCAAILVAIRVIAHDRIAVVAAALGMLAALVLFSQVGPGGSVIVPDSPLAMVWSIGLTAVVVLIVAWPDTSKLRGLQGT